MATGIFKSFLSTLRPWRPTSWNPSWKILADSLTGAPVGIQSQNANGPDGIWVPVDISAAQLSAPTAAMLADINATFRLDEAPYTRYQSDGNSLIPLGGGGVDGNTFPGAVVQTVPPGTSEVVIGPNSYAVVYSPFIVQNAAGVVVRGRLNVIARPA